MQANDTLDAGPPLILDILGAVPADGSAFTGISGGAIVNWIPNPGEANLAVTQTVAPVPSAAGTRLNYSITVTNGGPAAATLVTLIPGVPIGATGTTASATQGTCTLGSGGWSCALGNLGPGAVCVAEVSFIPATTGTLFTTASVSSQTPDSVIANNFHTIAASIVPAGQGVSLSLTKTDSIDPVAVDVPFTYTLTATNAGNTIATNVRGHGPRAGGDHHHLRDLAVGHVLGDQQPGALQLRLAGAGRERHDDVQCQGDGRRRGDEPGSGHVGRGRADAGGQHCDADDGGRDDGVLCGADVLGSVALLRDRAQPATC